VGGGGTGMLLHVLRLLRRRRRIGVATRRPSTPFYEVLPANLRRAHRLRPRRALRRASAAGAVLLLILLSLLLRMLLLLSVLLREWIHRRLRSLLLLLLLLLKILLLLLLNHVVFPFLRSAHLRAIVRASRRAEIRVRVIMTLLSLLPRREHRTSTLLLLLLLLMMMMLLLMWLAIVMVWWRFDVLFFHREGRFGHVDDFASTPSLLQFGGECGRSGSALTLLWGGVGLWGVVGAAVHPDWRWGSLGGALHFAQGVATARLGKIRVLI